MPTRNATRLLGMGWGVAAGGIGATSISWFIGTVYRDGLLLVPLLALVLAISISLVLYDSLAQRLTFSFFTAVLFSVLSLIVLSIEGRLSGPTVFGLGVAAVAIPIGIDLVLQDFGSRLTVPLLFSRRTVVTFLIAALPLSAWILAYQHLSAVEQDHALMRTVARHISPQGNTLVFELADSRQHERLRHLISIRTAEKTYSFSEATIATRQPAGRSQSSLAARLNSRTAASISREQAERMRLILHLQDTVLPDDITLFSHRGPLIISELKVSVGKRHGS